MSVYIEPWDYLIVTASNEEQAAAYEAQLGLRRELGLLSDVRNVLVVADPGGQRVGSGGSTVCCLLTVLNRELAGSDAGASDRARWEAILRQRRILVIHAGGDSKRLPPYGPCGKIFVPVPGESDSVLGTTLFDRQLPTYLALPPTGLEQGQVVIASGDVLLGFDPASVDFDRPGVTGLGCYATPDQACKHGVYCPGPEGSVRLFLQKPSPEEQHERGAVDRYDRAILDVGVMSFDAATAMILLDVCGAAPDSDGRLAWSAAMGKTIASHGLDFYREVCCALGAEATVAHHAASARGSGCTWKGSDLAKLHAALSAVPFHVRILPHCAFLHFGTLGQLITSGMDLLREDRNATRPNETLVINSDVAAGRRIAGGSGWVEGCCIEAELRLGGGNLVVGLDVAEPTSLPAHGCIDVLQGRDRAGATVWFVRCYGLDDDFKGKAGDNARILGIPVMELMRHAAASPADLWDPALPEEERALWNARLFPAVSEPLAYRDWLWLLEPETATGDLWTRWRAADRYSFAEMATLTDLDAFYGRRAKLRAANILQSLPRMLRPESGLSADDLARAMVQTADGPTWLAAVLQEAHRHYLADDSVADLSALNASRVLHTLGTALLRLHDTQPQWVADAFTRLGPVLTPADLAWLTSLGLGLADAEPAAWAAKAKALAFTNMGRTITASGMRSATCPRSALRRDEIVWGRAPARLDLGGGWSDTPPYTLERGGCVINAAIELNGQAPIQAYARVIDQPVLRLASIDFGERIEVAELADLLDYRRPGSQFSLPKAALAVSGLSPETAPWPSDASLRDILEAFGGGIELTTLAAIPGGSGLGTSSIVGAVVLAVVQRVMGRIMTPRELFHGVLRLEQEMTTGGGWQDQIGGVVDRVKIITTQPGLVPDPLIHYVPSDVLDSRANGGCTLLYYTGITRLAKNILQSVVGRYFDRERAAMATFERIHAFPARVADAMARKDLPAFGRALAAAWELKKRVDPGSTNEEIERLFAKMAPYIYGAKLMGAGGGGFVLIVCKSPEDAAALRAKIEAEPSNDRARFFDFSISTEGLVVTVC